MPWPRNDAIRYYFGDYTALLRIQLEQIGIFAHHPATIGDLALFQGETDPHVARLLDDCAVIALPEGERLPPAASPDGPPRMYIVLAGQLETGIDAPGSHGPASYRVVAGESVGEQAVLDGTDDLVQVRACTHCELLAIEAALLWELIDRSHVLARNLLRLLSFRVHAANAQLRRRQKLGEFYRQLSLNDPLTGLYNRAWLEDMLPKLVGRAATDGTPLSLIMIDLDHFKRFNDSHGHIAGDTALGLAADLIRNALRPSDYAVRFGGEEMMAILPDATPDQALAIAERLRNMLRTAVVFPDMRIALPHLTGSFGVASLCSGQDGRRLMAAADAALYRAKELGRDRVCQHPVSLN